MSAIPALSAILSPSELMFVLLDYKAMLLANLYFVLITLHGLLPYWLKTGGQDIQFTPAVVHFGVGLRFSAASSIHLSKENKTRKLLRSIGTEMQKEPRGFFNIEEPIKRSLFI
ncbi:MAG: hypothetical protein ACYTEO_15275, partial [Planctomycetota bacterium]